MGVGGHREAQTIIGFGPPEILFTKKAGFSPPKTTGPIPPSIPKCAGRLHRCITKDVGAQGAQLVENKRFGIVEPRGPIMQ